MGWSAGEAEADLARAFPWGAFVTVASGASFLSVAWDVEGAPPTKAADALVDEVHVHFWRDDQSNGFATVTRGALRDAVRTGVLRFTDGGMARQPEVEDLAWLSDPMEHFVGRQSPGETGWIARMRLHQSWWRTFRLRVPFGSGPTKGSTERYGNMLDAKAGAAGLNFLTAEAAGAYNKRVSLTRKGIGTFRTRHHLMASQTMAFNLFGHLDAHHDLATRLFDALLGPDEVAQVTTIEIERLSKALDDNTAFDVFTTYERTDDRGPACIAIETKLTEPFSQQAYDWARYISHSAFDRDLWTTDDPEVLGDLAWSQLFRNHLLGHAESAAQSLGPVTLLVVHHPEDTGCDKNVRDYCKNLRKDAPVQAVDIGRIHTILTDVAGGDASHRGWLADFGDRYLNLHLSNPLLDIATGVPR